MHLYPGQSVENRGASLDTAYRWRMDSRITIVYDPNRALRPIVTIARRLSEGL